MDESEIILLKAELQKLNAEKIVLLNSIVVYQYKIGDYEQVKRCEQELKLIDQ